MNNIDNTAHNILRSYPKGILIKSKGSMSKSLYVTTESCKNLSLVHIIGSKENCRSIVSTYASKLAISTIAPDAMLAEVTKGKSLLAASVGKKVCKT